MEDFDNILDVGHYSNDGEDTEERPYGERWPPLGAAAADEEFCDFNNSSLVAQYDSERLKELEIQQEKLNSSLIALTSHFAQVQFRLKQIVDAPAENKQSLLRDLEEFAFRGIPDIPEMSSNDFSHHDTADVEGVISKQKEKQKKLIGQLKGQLEELERYAYEMGEAGLPQSVLVEKQKVIIDELKGKLNLNVDDMDRLTFDDIRCQVDHAISQLVNPLKVKEQLVMQLKTQIMDLERFIDFLQADSVDIEKLKASSSADCTCPVHSPSYNKKTEPYFNRSSHSSSGEPREEAIRKTINMVRRAATLLQLFTLTQYGCGTSRRMNTLKKTMKINHWGDLRARLELAVVNLLALVSERDAQLSYDDYCSDGEVPSSLSWSSRVTRTARKQLAVSIRDLIQHGLMPMESSTSLVPFLGCFPSKSHDLDAMHAWELILRYYEMKNGARYNSTPVRKLSDSFNLDMVGSRAISHKQAMLSAIGQILNVHTQFKRSYDAQFKAFVCFALNCKKLVIWLRIIFRCQSLVELYYEPWSYMTRTGFEDGLQSLDKLSRISFDLPVDTAVHQFQNIRDAF